MIEIKGVQPTVREMRPLTRGWGGLHWWACLPILAPFLGLWSLALFAFADPWATSALGTTAAAIVILTSVAWMVTRWLYARMTVRAARSAPGGGLLSDWVIDEQGVEFRTGVSSARVSWSGIKAVREERDRFLFLLSPASNPLLPKRLLAETQLAAIRQLVENVTASGHLGRGVD